MPLPHPYPYIVTYQLQQPLNRYEPLFAELKRSSKWWHFLTSTWIVLNDGTLSELAAKLRPLIFQGDHILVMPAKGPADGWLPTTAWDWINKNLPREW